MAVHGVRKVKILEVEEVATREGVMEEKGNAALDMRILEWNVDVLGKKRMSEVNRVIVRLEEQALALEVVRHLELGHQGIQMTVEDKVDKRCNVGK